MNYQTFGKTGLKISRFGLGCMRFPKTVLADGSKMIEQDKVNEMVKYAYDNGVNYYDTAYLYPGSEKALGEAVKDIPREKIIITSKLPLAKFEKYDDCERFLDESLDALGTDYIDFYLLHSVIKKRWGIVKEHDLIGFMEKAKAAGKIKYIGFSFHDSLTFFKEIIDHYPWDMCQIQLNILDTAHQAGLKGLHYAADKGIPVVIMEPLRGGALVEKIPGEVQQLVNEYPVKKEMLEWAFKWLYHLPQVSTVLSGVSTLDQLKQNIDIADNSLPNSLTSEEQDLITNIKESFANYHKIGCTHCNYCMPCPQGVDIPGIFEFYNGTSMGSYVNHCKFQYTKFIYLPGHGADKCIECGECEEKCPQQLKIIDGLKAAHKVLLKSDMI